MRKRIRKILVAGGAGFIGSAFVRILARKGYRPVVVDKLSYAADLARISEVKQLVRFYKADITDRIKIESILRKERPDAVANFAAETHVDRSIKDPGAFLLTNITGTQVLLDSLRNIPVERFVHISTDEVYGDIEKGKFREDFPLKPNSPYAASKAGADLLIKAYIRTYGIPAVIVRPSNNYGPWQYPEKLIPRAVSKILNGEKVPVYAKGANIREWLYVDDCAKGILAILEKGSPGEIYNLGSGEEKKNIEVVKTLLKILCAGSKQIEFVRDRPGHDFRYRLDSRKVIKDTGWKPEISFRDGLMLTARWNFVHKKWLFSKKEEVARLYKKWC
jgi:dTDP-glucose 4,6-dehydratase